MLTLYEKFNNCCSNAMDVFGLTFVVRLIVNGNVLDLQATSSDFRFSLMILCDEVLVRFDWFIIL